jgi:hypothetical protein
MSTTLYDLLRRLRPPRRLSDLVDDDRRLFLYHLYFRFVIVQLLRALLQQHHVVHFLHGVFQLGLPHPVHALALPAVHRPHRQLPELDLEIVQVVVEVLLFVLLADRRTVRSADRSATPHLALVQLEVEVRQRGRFVLRFFGGRHQFGAHAGLSGASQQLLRDPAALHVDLVRDLFELLERLRVRSLGFEYVAFDRFDAVLLGVELALAEGFLVEVRSGFDYGLLEAALQLFHAVFGRFEDGGAALVLPTAFGFLILSFHHLKQDHGLLPFVLKNIIKNLSGDLGKQ